MKTVLWLWAKRQLLVLLTAGLLGLMALWFVLVGLFGLSSWLTWACSVAAVELVALSFFWIADTRDWWGRGHRRYRRELARRRSGRSPRLTVPR